MWICLPNGFLSAVQDTMSGKSGEPQLMVRSRVREHISHYFPNHEIFENTGTDYQYRIYINRKEFAQWLAKEAENIQYTNFKHSVKDRTLHTFYSDIWYLGWDILKQPYLKKTFEWYKGKTLKHYYDYMTR